MLQSRYVALGLMPSDAPLSAPVATTVQTMAIAVVAVAIIVTIGIVIVALVQWRAPRVRWGSFSVDFSSSDKEVK